MRALVLVVCVAVLVGSAVSARESYRVYVTRKESNLYQIDGSKMYIKTRLCLELAIAEPAILNYERYSFDNKLIFDKQRRPESCDVEAVLTED